MSLDPLPGRAAVAWLACLCAAACAVNPVPTPAAPTGATAAAQSPADTAAAGDASKSGASGQADDANAGPEAEAADAGAVDAAADTDAGPDTATDSGAELTDVAEPFDAAQPVDAAAADIGPSTLPPPDQWGPYPVGTRVKNWTDPARNNRAVTTRLWYPIVETGGDKAIYFDAVVIKVQGKAINKGTADKSKGPLPVVLFSHGFKGIDWQSVEFTEYLASHGYVVAAPDHAGNTLFDVSVSKEVESKSALERPIDVRFAYDELAKLNGPGGGDFEGLLDLQKVAITGHSFGGYTTLVVAGATVNVDEAKAGCKTASNMLCKGGYMNYWPDGTVLKMPKPISGLKAAIGLSPGFFVAFGQKGLASVSVPTLVFGGTLDGTTPVADDIDPIYAALPLPKGEVVIAGGGHMSYTGVCGLPPAQFVAELKDMCFKPGMIDGAKAFAITNAFAVAWLNRFVKGDVASNPLLQQSLPAKFPLGQAKTQGL